MSILRRTSSGFGSGASSGWGAVGVFMLSLTEAEVKEITYEMTEAGVAVFESLVNVAPPAVLVDQIFAAMLRAQRKSK